MDCKKISDTCIEVTRSVTEIKTATYERSFIEEQIKRIEADRDAYLAAREAELAECRDILAEMNKAGVKATKKEKV